MPGLATLTATSRVFAPPRRRARRIRARRLRAVARASVQSPLELSDPLALPRDGLRKLLDLAIHPQQHLDHDIAARVIDRLRLSPIHTPRFDTAELCPPDPLNANQKMLICRRFLPMRAEGLEPPRAFAHRLLRPACLPIPPRPRGAARSSRALGSAGGPGAQIGKGSGLKSRRSQELVGSSPTPGMTVVVRPHVSVTP